MVTMVLYATYAVYAVYACLCILASDPEIWTKNSMILS